MAARGLWATKSKPRVVGEVLKPVGPAHEMRSKPARASSSTYSPTGKHPLTQLDQLSPSEHLGPALTAFSGVGGCQTAMSASTLHTSQSWNRPPD